MLLPLKQGRILPFKHGRKTSICFIDYAKAFDCVDHNKLWKTLKEMGIPDHLTCLLRNLHASQEATVKTGHGTTDWFQIGKGVCQGYILSPCLFKSCPTLCNPIDCSLPGSSVHGIFQAIVLEWVTISFSRGSSRPRDRTQVSCIGGRRFNL